LPLPCLPVNRFRCDLPVTTACGSVGAVTVLGVVAPYSIPGVASLVEVADPDGSATRR